MVVRSDSGIDDISVRAFRIPTDAPESDGTFEWNATTMIVVRAHASGHEGLGYTYGSRAAGVLIQDELAASVKGRDAMDIPGCWDAMMRATRNEGHAGITCMAIAAVDTALWDLKARILGLPLVQLLGAARGCAPIYGSGGFTSYSISKLTDQLGGWAEQGVPRVKMKIGRDAGADVERVRAARQAIGETTELFVDANGAYSRKQALALAERFSECDVRWFEEPVSSDDLAGLHLIRDRSPAGMDIAAGEYGYDAFYFRRMLEANAVDVLQADATRCGGITGFLQADALCAAHGVALSAHCAPALHLHPGCAARSVCHLEYFHDHVRMEEMIFDGVVRPKRGTLTPDTSRNGHGLTLRESDAARFSI